jgi:hypothetical protein
MPEVLRGSEDALSCGIGHVTSGIAVDDVADRRTRHSCPCCDLPGRNRLASPRGAFGFSKNRVHTENLPRLDVDLLLYRAIFPALDVA